MNDKYLECWKLNKTFATPAGPFVAVQDFDLNLAEGEFVSLIGHSGCGKSTVLSMVAGLLPKDGGAMILDNREVRGTGPDRAVVFQSPCLLPWFNAMENVLLGIEQVFPKASREERRDTAAHYLELVGLGAAMHKRPAELSQGMQQRVGIARAFALAPKLLLLDEPFCMLDSLTRMELQEVLLGVWRKSRITALMVTHDVDEALFLSDRVAMMTNGPAARVGSIVDVHFARPRERAAVLEHPEYYDLREQLIGFLEAQDHRKRAAEAARRANESLAETSAQPRLEQALLPP
ncbi:MAG: nitrate ABC transporter ATP-binding protein [Tepidisphaeraceae bacterium]